MHLVPEVIARNFHIHELLLVMCCFFLQDGLHRHYDEYVLTAPRDSRAFPRAPSGAHLANFIKDSWDEVTPKVMIRSAIACGVVRICDYSP